MKRSLLNSVFFLPFSSIQSDSRSIATFAQIFLLPNQIHEHRIHLSLGQNDFHPTRYNVVYTEPTIKNKSIFYAQRSKWTRKLKRSKRSKHDVKPIERGGSYTEKRRTKTHWHRISNFKIGAEPIGATSTNNIENDKIIRRRRDSIIGIRGYCTVRDGKLILLNKTQPIRILLLLPKLQSRQ